LLRSIKLTPRAGKQLNKHKYIHLKFGKAVKRKKSKKTETTKTQHTASPKSGA